MTTAYAFADVARTPMPGDNVAIATRRLAAGSRIQDGSASAGAASYTLSHEVMEGHRFVCRAIAEGEALLSWELPFGHAIRAIEPGEYVCNAKMLAALRHRDIDFALPGTPNFRDHYQTWELDEATFVPGTQVAPATEPRTFNGYLRDGLQSAGRRGVGTRNHVIILATSSRTAGFARRLAERLQAAAAHYPTIDGVVAVTHTEGGAEMPNGAVPNADLPNAGMPNNADFLLRTLAGFMVHPNVAAVLTVDRGDEAISNAVLRGYMTKHGYGAALQSMLHSFFSIERGFAAELQRAEALVGAWLPEVGALQRTPQPVSELKLALQCGGSDAFSGVSGNPLAGWVAREVVRHGGAANLAETDELIGAEPYILNNTRDAATARRFLGKIETFKERARWHGYTAEGNPSGGNLYRGLYNITLKSIGAARKKDPDVRLDYVIDYAQPMREPGYYFMDSPGNDLESIAGQVASGANLILFITGNGSITNFPFAPTLKFVTTTGRWEMLANEMDVNAGRYQDGVPLEELGRETFELALEVASGRRSLGEQAGHAQVSIWRDWAQTDDSNLAALQNRPEASAPSPAVNKADGRELRFPAIQGVRGPCTDQVGLVVPTSICSAQIARMMADRLNERAIGGTAVSRYVALVHTEGCGAAAGYSTKLYLRTVLGHLRHPMVRRALLVEHGCEQTHNDAMRGFLSEAGVDVNTLGWASVQMDGGIDSVLGMAEDWFSDALTEGAAASGDAGPEALRLGLTAAGTVAPRVAQALALLARQVASNGGLVVIPENAPLLRSPEFRKVLLTDAERIEPTLAYGQAAEGGGLHIMETPTRHHVETLTGLGATGVEVMLSHVTGAPVQTHPMIPLLQVSADPATRERHGEDLDLVLDAEKCSAEELQAALVQRVLEVASRRYTPNLFGQGNSDFQLTRGWLGLSL